MNDDQIKYLALLKTKYLYSKQISLRNFFKFSNIELPDFIDIEDILH